MNVTSTRSTAAPVIPSAVTQTAGVQSSKEQTASAIKSTDDTYESKLSEIASKYDPRHISLDDIPKLAKELYDNGLISNSDYSAMSSQAYFERSAEKDGLTIGLAGGSDGTSDLVRVWKNNASYQPTAEATRSVAQTANILESLSFLPHNQSVSVNTNATPQSNIDIHGAISAYETGIENSTMDAQRVVDVLEALVAKKKV